MVETVLLRVAGVNELLFNAFVVEKAIQSFITEFAVISGMKDLRVGIESDRVLRDGQNAKERG